MAAQAPPIFQALANTVRVCELPASLLEDLVSAFRQDVTVTRYASWEALFDYCRRSANPVGRLVLRIGGWRDTELDAASDAVCTALQLTNFWQDLAIDWGRGRLYVPAEAHETARAELAALDRGEWTAEWQQALASCAARTRALFDCGRAVCDGVTGRLRFELRATWLGGVRVLDRLEASRFDVFRARPSLGAGDLPSIAWHALWWLPGEPATSFYYAFLSLPRAERDAIVAVWDFCRAVDDTVDEAPAIAAVGAERIPLLSPTSARGCRNGGSRSIGAIAERRPRTSGGPFNRGCSGSRCRAHRSRTSWTASRWTSIASVISRSRSSTNTAGVWRRPWD